MTSKGDVRDSYMEALRDSKKRRNLISSRNMQLQFVENSTSNSAQRSNSGEGVGSSRIIAEQNPGTDEEMFRDNTISTESVTQPPFATDLEGSGHRRVAFHAASGTNAMVAWRELVKDSLDLKEDDTGDNEEEAKGHSLPIYAPPLQRQKWGEDQILPHINWGDLFFDLFYVAAAYNLGALLISALTPELWFHGVVYFIGIFGPLFNAWESKLVYEARYSVIDYFHRVIEVVRVFFLSISVLHIKPLELMSDPRSAETFFFCLGLFLECLIRIFLKSELIRVGKGDVEAIRNHSKRKLIVSYIPLAIFFLVATIIAGEGYWNQQDSSGYKDDASAADDGYDKDIQSNGEHRFLAGSKPLGNYSNEWSRGDLPITICAIAYLYNLIFTVIRKTIWLPNSKDFRKQNVPSNIDFCIHRYGEWTMLMLGEAVLSLLIVTTTEDFDYYFVALAGVLTVIMIQALHFESEPSHADHHALWRNMQAGMWYSVLLQLLSMGLIAFGVSYKVMLKGIHKEAEYATKESAYGSGSDYGGSYGDDKGGDYTDGYGDDKGEDYGEGGRLLIEESFIGGDGGFFDLSQRFLAGSVKVSDDAAAGLFVGSLTITLICLELLTLTHRGMHENLDRLFHRQTDGSTKLRLEIIFLSLFKLGLIVFLATLSQWLNDPKWVALTGFFIVACIAGSRVVGWSLVHGTKAH